MFRWKAKPKDSPGVHLRQMFLSTPVRDFKFTPNKEFPTVYGVLTDWYVSKVIVSILSMRDGTASLYSISTFGIIGGQTHEKVRQAAIRYVKNAEEFVSSSEIVEDYPYPERGQVFFYILTYDGVKRCIGDLSAIEDGTDPMRPLFESAQEVVTELRLLTEKEKQK